jgi:hypothetical protein
MRWRSQPILKKEAPGPREGLMKSLREGSKPDGRDA